MNENATFSAFDAWKFQIAMYIFNISS